MSWEESFSERPGVETCDECSNLEVMCSQNELRGELANKDRSEASLRSEIDRLKEELERPGSPKRTHTIVGGEDTPKVSLKKHLVGNGWASPQSIMNGH